MPEKRNEVSENLKWDMSVIFKDDAEFDEVLSALDKIEKGDAIKW